MPGVSEQLERGDSDELAQFGYKQELDRSLGASRLRRRVQLHLDPDRRLPAVLLRLPPAGPAFFWTWPVVFVGQFLVALCFAELAGQYPARGVRLPVVEADRRAVHVVDGRLAPVVGSIVTWPRWRSPTRWSCRRSRRRSRSSAGPRTRASPDAGRREERGAARGRARVFTTIVTWSASSSWRGSTTSASSPSCRRHAADHPAGRPHPRAGRASSSRPTAPARATLGLLRRLPGRRRQRVRPVRVRHGRVAGRGDERPAEARAARDPPRARRGRAGRRRC